MKILLDLQGAQTESRFRGIGRQTLSLARALIRRAQGHDVHVLLNRRLNEGLEALVEEFSELVSTSNVHLFGVPGATAERDPGNLWRTYAAEHLREAAVAEIAPDIVHIASLFEGYVDDAVASIGWFDAPYATAVTLHDLIPLADPERYLSEAGTKRHWLRKAQFLKRADLLLAVSRFSAAEAEARLSIPDDRIAVISAGVDPAFRPSEMSIDAAGALRRRYDLDQPFVLYVGAVDPRKNVQLIFAALAASPQTIQDDHLIVFAGRLFDEEIGHLKVLAARHGVAASKLRFLQQVPEDDLIALYGICAAFVFPSLNEGFGLPALEAMACGAPTLAARGSSLTEVVGHEALMFDPLDAKSLAASLTRLLQQPEAREEAVALGLARAAEFNWDHVADRTLDAFEAVQGARADTRGAVAPLSRKPRLAYFSPLPSEESGIANYSAALLPELARFYEIDCIVAMDAVVNNDWIEANFVIRDLAFFERNAHTYDRVVYNIGNSHFHAHMLPLIRRFPGVVILHDFFLSDLIDWMSGTGLTSSEDYYKELYRTHGLTGLDLERRLGRRQAVEALPTNGVVFEAAMGVIVHSEFAVGLAHDLFGASTAQDMTVIPHLKAVERGLDRAEERRRARARLGLLEDDLLVCSFGVMTQRKRSLDLLTAWDACKASQRSGAKLVFVGGNSGGEYGAALDAAIGTRADVTITGFAPDALYRDYLAAADIAVQLRSQSRGETSGTVLDCLAQGLPVIVNAHGATAELPDDWVLKLQDDFTHVELSAALDRLASNPQFAREQAARGQEGVRIAYHPARIGDRFHEAIEGHASGRAALEKTTVAAIADFVSPTYPDRDDFRRTSAVLAARRARPGLRQILYDITVLAESDAKTGIQRVVRSILVNLIANPPPGYRVEPIRMDGHQFRYARAYVTDHLGLPTWVLPESPVEFDKGDLYLAIDWVPDRLPLVEDWLTDFRRAGGRVVIGVHDLLPLMLPQYFPPFMPSVMQSWFETSLRVADQFLCVSATVADDVVKFGRALSQRQHRRPIAVDYFHNAADLEGSIPSRGRPDDADDLLKKIRSRRTFLMVGTVEPRKRHEQVLQAFQQLWRAEEDVALVIVGKAGWMMGPFAELLAAHDEAGSRLFWLQGISDEFLDDVYAASCALIAASAGEGFGLPLIEAALHKRPLIARDIPVFREVAGEHAFYFSGDTPPELAAALKAWIRADQRGEAPSTEGMTFQTWNESTKQVIDRLFAESHYATL